jgi:serine/threonine protein kinase
MTKRRSVIGEGAYGCVHKPSLHCKNPPNHNFNYDSYVSKLMKKKRAEEELHEFVKFHRYDKQNEYHLGTPIRCELDINKKMDEDVAECEKMAPKVFLNPENYGLLVMKYGGHDLKIFCKNEIKKYLRTKKNEKSDKFWLEAHHLITGLQFFKDNHIVHNDLKPQNILFDTKTNKLMFIDFGLMRTKSEITKLSKNNTNNLGVFHWSYPLDCGFMNHDDYTKYYKGSSNGYRSLVKTELTDIIVSGDKKNTYSLDIDTPEAFNLFFSYTNLSGKDQQASAKYAILNDFFDGLDENIKKNYDNYLETIIDSIDVYGLGFSLQYILNCFMRNNAVSSHFYNRASALFSKMYESNPEKRELDIHILLDEYEDILLETGILSRLNKSFENHRLVDSAPMPSLIMRLAEKEERSRTMNKPLSEKMESIAYLDPGKAKGKTRKHFKNTGSINVSVIKGKSRSRRRRE